MSMGDWDFAYGNPTMPLDKETDTKEGGGKPGKPSAQKMPKAPDAEKLIELQGIENRVNEIGPSGSTMYTRDPNTRVWTANRKFSPELQNLYNKQVGMISGDPNAYNQQVADTMFARSKANLDPMFQQQDRALEQKLADQGLSIGSEAYRGEMDRMQRMQNEGYTGASRDATLAGSQLGTSQRTNEFNQMAALLGGQQVGPTAPIDVTGPFASNYAGQVAGVNASNANAAMRQSSNTSAAASLASVIAKYYLSSGSSEAIKENKEEIKHDETLESVEALRVERWTYKPGFEDESEHIGPYAEEFKELFGVGDGKRISFVDAIGVCLSAIKGLSARVKELEGA